MTKRPTRKKRIEHIYGTTAKDVGEIILRVDQRTGTIHFDQVMTNVYSEINYERAKGPKILSRIPQSRAGASFDPSLALLKNYDFLCAVDTNTRIINEQKVSVVGIVTFRQANPPPNVHEYWQLDVPFCWEFVGLKAEKPENFGWLAALEELAERNLIKPSTKVGMVVDSDLGNLGDYNYRRKPVFEDSLLPPNVRLIYASADAGKEAIVNRVLSVADSIAGQVLEAVGGGKVAFNTKKVDHPWYEGARIVHAKTMV